MDVQKACQDWFRKNTHTKEYWEKVDVAVKANEDRIDKMEAYQRAHSMVTSAIRQGKLVRGPCEICGSRKTEGHHADYSKPLEVVWLCKKHHEEEHVRINRH